MYEPQLQCPGTIKVASMLLEDVRAQTDQKNRHNQMRANEDQPTLTNAPQYYNHDNLHCIYVSTCTVMHIHSYSHMH